MNDEKKEEILEDQTVPAGLGLSIKPKRPPAPIPVGISEHRLSTNQERAAARQARDGFYVVRKKKQGDRAFKIVIDSAKWSVLVDHTDVDEGESGYIVLEVHG